MDSSEPLDVRSIVAAFEEEFVLRFYVARCRQTQAACRQGDRLDAVIMRR